MIVLGRCVYLVVTFLQILTLKSLLDTLASEFVTINWIEIVIALIGSTIVGYFISIWASRNYEKQKAKREKLKLRTIHKDSAGHFENYNFNGARIGEKISDATLEYAGDNIFKIRVTTYLDSNANPLSNEEIQIWKGRVWMEGIRNGDITFYFLQPRRQKNEFGFKRIIISPNRNHIILFGEGGHGIERFERKTRGNKELS